MTSVTTCPDDRLFRQVLIGDTSLDVEFDLARHLIGCDKCAARMRSALSNEATRKAVHKRGEDRPLWQFFTDSKKLAASAATMSRADALEATQHIPKDPSKPPTKEDPLASDANDPAATMQVASSIYSFLAPPESKDEIGRLGGYHVKKLLGAGGMGMVFQAEDPQLKRKIALKVMRPEVAAISNAKERFLREARTMASIEHDHVVAVFQVGEDRTIPFMAMPFLQGMPLDAVLKKNPSIPLTIALRMGFQIANGLAAAHSKGLIHRDIKPANIWIETQNNNRVKLLDFGLARGDDEEVNLTQSGAVLGTPAYMAPEQAAGGEVDARADLFSLGVVLYELTAGKRPFTGAGTMAILTALAIHNPPPPREIAPAIPENVSDFIMRLLAKDPERRVGSAQEASKELATIIKAKAAEPKEAPVANDTVGGVGTGMPTIKTLPRHRELSPPSKPVSVALRATSASGDKRKKMLLAAIGGGVLGLLAITFAVITILMRTPYGTLEVVIDDPSIEARFKNGSLILTDDAGKVRYTLRPAAELADKNERIKAGDYKLRVEGADGLTVDTEKFSLKDGNHEIVRVILKPNIESKPETTSVVAAAKEGATTTVAAMEAPDQGLEFDGLHDFVETPVLYNGSHPLTIEALVYPVPITRNDGFPEPVFCVANNFESLRGIALFLKEPTTGYPQWGAHASQALQPPYASSMQLDTSAKNNFKRWQWISGVFTPGGEMAIYIDGKRQSVAKLPKHEPSILPFYLGTNPGRPPDPQNPHIKFFCGKMAEVRISRSARYQGDYTPKNRLESDADTLALYHFEEGAGAVLTDSSGKGNHGKITGAKWLVSSVKDDRRFAEWMIANKYYGNALVGNQIVNFGRGKPLPTEPFVVSMFYDGTTEPLPENVVAEGINLFRKLTKPQGGNLPRIQSDRWAQEFGQKPTIEIVNAYRSDITDEGIAKLAELPLLKFVNLDLSTHVTLNGLRVLANCSKLETLSLDPASVREGKYPIAEIQKLQDAMPHVNIQIAGGVPIEGLKRRADAPATPAASRKPFDFGAPVVINRNRSILDDLDHDKILQHKLEAWSPKELVAIYGSPANSAEIADHLTTTRMSTDGKWFARTGGFSGVRVWPNGDQPGLLPFSGYHRQDAKQTGLAISTDSKLLAYSIKTPEGPSLVELVDLTAPAKGVIRRLAPSSENGITAIAFHPDGKRLLTGTGFGGLYSWDLSKDEKAKPQQTIITPKNANHAIAPNIDIIDAEHIGVLLIDLERDQTQVVVFDGKGKTIKPEYSVPGGIAAATTFALSENGNSVILCGSIDGKEQFIERSPKGNLASAPLSGRHAIFARCSKNHLAYSGAGGWWIAKWDRGLKSPKSLPNQTWAIADDQSHGIAIINGSLPPIVFDADGKSPSMNSNQPISNQEKLTHYPDSNPTLVTRGLIKLIPPASIWSNDDQGEHLEPITQPKANEAYLFSISFNAATQTGIHGDGRFVFGRGWDNHFRYLDLLASPDREHVWRTVASESLKAICTWSAGRSPGQVFLVSDENFTVHEVDLRQQPPALRQIGALSSKTYQLRISQDGRYLVAPVESGQIEILDLSQAPAKKMILPSPAPNRSECIGFGEDPKRLLMMTSNQTLVSYELENLSAAPQEILRDAGRLFWVSPGNNYVLSTSNLNGDREMKLFDLRSRDLLFQDRFPSGLTGCNWAEDGRHFQVTTMDATYVYRVAPPAP